MENWFGNKFVRVIKGTSVAVDHVPTDPNDIVDLKVIGHPEHGCDSEYMPFDIAVSPRDGTAYLGIGGPNRLVELDVEVYQFGCY